MISQAQKNFRLRSFVRRDSRCTKAQERARLTLAPHYGLDIAKGFINYREVFNRDAPTFLEIGFGSGQSLLALAKTNPEYNLIGVETHKPGIGTLFQGMETENLTNIRIYYADVIDVLDKCIPDNSLDGVQIFFPDPWPKRRHHPRRLIQPAFVKKITQKLIKNGVLYLATDWEDYGKHMLNVLGLETDLVNTTVDFSNRSPHRPVITKFERRALQEGRKIKDLHFRKR